MHVLEKTLGQLIDENFLYARALKILGVDFNTFSDISLGQICQLRGFNKNLVLRTFYQADTRVVLSIREIEQLPLSYTLIYLRQAHRQYIQSTLPYIAGLIDTLSEKEGAFADLGHMFPMFVEDFIYHIYEEEDQLFTYVSLLLKIQNGNSVNPTAELWPFREFSLSRLLDLHVDDDELSNLRTFLAELPETTLLMRLIKRELAAFDKEIMYHSEIENSILFPKAIKLEKSVFESIEELTKLN